MGNIDLLEDACAKLPHTSRKMFGGHGLFAPNGGMFAGIVDDDRIILKFAKEEPDHAAFLATGTKPWVYEGKMGAMTMKEWLLVPDEMYDEPATLAHWCARAHKIAPGKAAKKARAPAAATRPNAPKKRAPAKAPPLPKKSSKKSAQTSKPAKRPSSKKPKR